MGRHIIYFFHEIVVRREKIDSFEDSQICSKMHFKKIPEIAFKNSFTLPMFY